jgi:hypothetical protein
MRVDPLSNTSYEDLCDEPRAMMVTRIRLFPNDEGVQKFAVILLLVHHDKWVTVIRYDGSKHERVHAHYFYKNPPKKEYHTKSISSETIEVYQHRIRQNWRLYVGELRDNYI